MALCAGVEQRHLAQKAVSEVKASNTNVQLCHQRQKPNHKECDCRRRAFGKARASGQGYNVPRRSTTGHGIPKSLLIFQDLLCHQDKHPIVLVSQSSGKPLSSAPSAKEFVNLSGIVPHLMISDKAMTSGLPMLIRITSLPSRLPFTSAFWNSTRCDCFGLRG